jgi:hypothetical protein
MDAATRDLLQEIVRRESLSLLSYVGDSFPWTTSRGGPALEQLRHLVAAHREAVADLGRFLTRRRMPLGYIGSYPSSFTTINFVSLGYVLRRLVEWETKAVADLERDLAGLRHDPEAKALVEKLLAGKKERLEKLQILAAEQATPAAS